MNIAVLGAGVSGLTAGRLLQDQGHTVIVYEKNQNLGGLARTRETAGFLYDLHGGHILNSKHQEVLDWVFSLLPKEKWQFTQRNAKIDFDGKYIPYPFELSLRELDLDVAADCICDYLTAQNGPRPDNFKDWLVWYFGKSIAELYMLPYNEKIWTFSLDQMEVDFMAGKMPMPSKREIIKSILLNDPTERKMPHSTFYYPLKGGIQTMINAIANGIKTKTNYRIEKISRGEKGWYVDNEGPYDRVISTIPLPELPPLMNLPETVKEHIADLKYNSLTTALFQCEKTDITWLYIPSHRYKSHRVCYLSAFTPYACPQNHMGCGSLEIIGSQFSISEEMIKNHSILPENIGFQRVLDTEFTKYAYVIHDKNYRYNTDYILGFFAQLEGFDLLGRWGTWNYKNMDLCIYDAMLLAKQYEMRSFSDQTNLNWS